ncbi:MAG: hypothetical protein NWR30_02495 [Salibacteraceae bacterium]|jgi:hypothetical protein|nr:hypothetical protein [Salibacteraceae bacterium]MDP4763139.1 hypothetical protein [Salibacteraceae bacterium]MDP4844824.1 hypothetical protein [Salibacteraceae bacterium]MDP4933557.1 hypothetical protein [Salibacteraceae bacterium]
MLSSNNEHITLKVQKTEKYLLYRVVGPRIRPLRFDLINLDGRKVRSIDLLFGKEFVIPISGLKKGEHLFALSSAAELLQTGVIEI